MANYLVTGGYGFIGSHLVDRLIAEGHFVRVIDDESSDNDKFYKNESAENLNQTINSYDVCLDAVKKIDGIFHLAAESRLQPSIINPDRAINTNYVGTYNVLKAAKASGVKKCVFSSTSSIYGTKNLPPLVETMPAHCLNPYSGTKYSMEILAKVYDELYGVTTTCLRYFNVYGSRMPTTGQYAPVIGLFLKMRNQNKPLTIVGDGQQERDFIHVSDVINANILAMRGQDSTNEDPVYNIGFGKSFKILDIAKHISCNYEFVPHRKGEVISNLCDNSKAKRVFGWSPKINLFDWLNDNL